MKYKKFLPLFGLVLVVLLLAACGASTTPSKTVSQTDTETSPADTPTPTCELLCNVDLDGYGFEITCESGAVNSTMSDSTELEYGNTNQVATAKINVNQELTYEDTNNTYKVVGNIVVDMSSGTVSYNITATGGAFGEESQTCKSGDVTGSAVQPTQVTADIGLIKGLFPDDIVRIAEQRGLECDGSKISEQWYTWKCNFYKDSDWLGYVEFYSKSPDASVDQIEGLVLEPDNSSAIDILTLTASLPYEDAEPDKAKTWVEQTLPTLEANKDVQETFGGVKYTLENYCIANCQLSKHLKITSRFSGANSIVPIGTNIMFFDH